MKTVEVFLQNWGYLGVFLGIVVTGVPFVPLPEELPIVVGGGLAGGGTVFWWLNAAGVSFRRGHGGRGPVHARPALGTALTEGRLDSQARAAS